MKIPELKHWQSYLDTELKCSVPMYSEKTILTLKGIEIVENGYVLLFDEFGEYPPEHVYPYLYPLDWLTKEIEHNGEKFVPKDKFNVPLDLDSITWAIRENELFATSRYAFVQQLIEWHFDVFGLIDKGLAIDKSTI